MTISGKGIEFIKQFEGLSLTAYEDGGGVWTIGYGTILYPNGIKVREGDVITEQEAIEYLHFEVKKKALAVQSAIKEVPVNQNQFDSLVSLVYNIGSEAFAKSTLLKKVKQNPHDPTIYVYTVDREGVPIEDSCEWCRWCRDNGKIIKGLLIRRGKECDIYNS